jgi:hypothetical protein
VEGELLEGRPARRLGPGEGEPGAAGLGIYTLYYTLYIIHSIVYTVYYTPIKWSLTCGWGGALRGASSFRPRGGNWNIGLGGGGLYRAGRV